ncbi:hypothetical protein C8F01DRAFT_1181036 [Mycena amicta]|nr:hypothetical protein C8F01DRAFT_1181036 [Mycena amicta]
MSAKKSASSAKKNEPEEAYEPGDIVLGKASEAFRPGQLGLVVDPDNVPRLVAKERPSSRKATAYVIRFFPVGDYAWMSSSDLQRLSTEDCEEYIKAANDGKGGETKGKKELLEGYKAVVSTPIQWEKELDSAPPPKKKGGKKKKDSDGDEDGEDGPDADGDDDDGTSGKKRKRAAAKPGKSSPKKKGGKSKKSKETIESEEEGADEEAEPKERPSKKSKGDKAEAANPKLENDPEALKVRDWRHRLQKTFLNSSKLMPKEEEMPGIDELFTTVEQYQDMNIDYLTVCKVPRDAEFHFRDRAKALVDHWHQILNANKDKGSESHKKTAAGMNGAAGGADADGEGDLTMLDETQA